jgi:hypothetical protein
LNEAQENLLAKYGPIAVKLLGQHSMDGYEAMGFDVTQLTQDLEQSLFTIKTNMPIPMLVYGDSFQWAKYGHHILPPNLDLTRQQLCYIQKRGLTCSPVELFNKGLVQQMKEWMDKGEWIVLLMDVNNHPLNSKFYQQLQREHTDLEEFTHKCWGPTPPYVHISGSPPIDGGYKSPEIEIVNLGMLSFTESPGDLRSFIIDISTCLLLEEFRFKVCRPVSRRLVTSQQQSVDRYNKIVRDQFNTHRIMERMNAINKMTRYCGYPSPPWLRAMITKLYKKMTEIRVHAEKD